MTTMRKALVLLAALGLTAVAGCGGDDQSSGLCQSLRTAQDAVQDIATIQPGEGAAQDLKQSAGKLRSSLNDVKEEAGDDLGPQVDAVESSMQGLQQSVQSLASEGNVSADSVKSLAAQIGDAASSLRALADAAPDCNLSG
ncbi:MAG TPA: hypothetical protein VH306_08415 [Gaiellaceae bacterium]|jgi:methyl-accepting chemotaxis protein